MTNIERLEALKDLLNIEPWAEQPYIEAIDAGIAALCKETVVHGKWIRRDKAYLECSVCGAALAAVDYCKHKYCFNCAAIMDNQ